MRTKKLLWLVLSLLTIGSFGASAQMLIPLGSTWKYLDNGSDQGTAWTDALYSDASWNQGVAPLGYTMTGVATTISFGPSSSNKYVTSYFRQAVNVTLAELNSFDSLKVSLNYDDGGAVYINGVEVLRVKLTAGAAYNTLATSPAVGSAPANGQVTVPKSLLIEGQNIIAVEIHQQALTSSDQYFDLSIQKMKNDVVLAGSGSAWKYNDGGVSLSTDWKDVIYDDSQWATGNGVFGYGNNDETTVVSYGANPVNKHMTTYFRKSIEVTSTAGYNTLKLMLKRDDGSIVYVNGVDVFRSNMPIGATTFNTAALSYIEGEQENEWLVVYLPVAYLTIGTNVVAVEIHKFNAFDSDLRFDMQIALQEEIVTQTLGSQNITCDPSQSQAIGCFTSVLPQAQTPGLIIPSTHTFQSIAKQGTANFYTNSASAMPGNNDFTGYVPSNGSSKQGILSVNHENDPGDVSLLSIHLDEVNQVWVRDSARRVDFSQLVRTTRNCSGGVTPWGTVVTSEETYATGDVNGDGYTDRGWQVEIDPVSGKIVDYNGDSQPDKVWAMGRMNHENIALSADSLVAYQTEDGGTSGVYKYVMDTKANLSAGTLYVLKRDTPTSSTGVWVQVPNTTQAQRNTVSGAITALGGTNWANPEDIEFGLDGKMYFTSKNNGIIWRFKDDGTTISEIEPWVTNTSYPIIHANGTTNEGFGTGIDNLAFDSEGNLWAQQDGGRNHIWVIRPDHTPAVPKVDLFAIIPAGAESGGLTFTPDHKFGFLSIMHPTGSNSTVLVDAADNNVVFNNATTFIIARKENLGAGARLPIVELGDSVFSCATATLTGSLNPDVLNVWTGGSNATTLEVTQTGWYTLTTYANNGRSAVDSVFVTIYPIPSAPLVSDAEKCFAQSTPELVAVGTDIKWYQELGLTTLLASTATYESTEEVEGVYNYYVTQTDLNGCVSAPASVNYTIHGLPVAPITQDEVVCFGTAVPTLQAVGSDIEWYSTPTMETVLATGANFDTQLSQSGVYTYYTTQTDVNGCASLPTPVQLTINALPSAPTVSNASNCFGLSNSTLTASGNSVEWFSDASATALVASGTDFVSSEQQPGVYTYYATQTDVNNCRSEVSPTQFTIHALPSTPLAQNEQICFGESSSNLTASGSQVNWYSVADLSTLIGSGNDFISSETQVGNYTYYATETNQFGCVSAPASVNYTILALPSLAVAQNEAVCFGTAVPQLSAVGSSINWYSTPTMETLVATGSNFDTQMTQSGVYSYYTTQTDANGCTSLPSQVQLTIYALPSAPTTVNVANCFGTANPTLNVNGSSIEWYSDAAATNLIASGNQYVSSEQQAGVYNYFATQTDLNNCQSDVASIQFTIHALPAMPVAQDQQICVGDNTPNLAASGIQVNWYSAADLSTLVGTGNVLVTGQDQVGTYTYYVTQTNQYGCVSDVEIVELSINDYPTAPAITGTTVYCEGESIDPFTAVGSNVLWYNNDLLTAPVGQGNSFVPSTAGMYYATQAVNGCTSDASSVTLVVNPLPSVSLTGLNSSYYVDDIAVVVTGVPQGGVFTGVGLNGQYFVPVEAGIGGPYTITYTYTDSQTGCSNTAINLVTVNSLVGTYTLPNGTGISLFPNPATEEMNVNIQMQDGEMIDLTMLDAAGKVLYNDRVNTLNQEVYQLSLNRSEMNLASGTYFLHVSVNGYNAVLKVVFN